MIDLRNLAAEIVERLREHFPDTDLSQQQVLCLAEEAGEFVGAYRRWAGMARRTGSWEDVKAELADVTITAYVTAELLGVADALESIRDSLGDPLTHVATRQVRAVFRAVGDLVDAFDRPVQSTSLVATRIAVVINLAHATAQVLGIDLDAAVKEKTQVVFSRGWRDKPAEVAQ